MERFGLRWFLPFAVLLLVASVAGVVAADKSGLTRPARDIPPKLDGVDWSPISVHVEPSETSRALELILFPSILALAPLFFVIAISGAPEDLPAMVAIPAGIVGLALALLPWYGLGRWLDHLIGWLPARHRPPSRAIAATRAVSVLICCLGVSVAAFLMWSDGFYHDGGLFFAASVWTTLTGALLWRQVSVWQRPQLAGARLEVLSLR